MPIENTTFLIRQMFTSESAHSHGTCHTAINQEYLLLANTTKLKRRNNEVRGFDCRVRQRYFIEIGDGGHWILTANLSG